MVDTKIDKVPYEDMLRDEVDNKDQNPLPKTVSKEAMVILESNAQTDEKQGKGEEIENQGVIEEPEEVFVIEREGAQACFELIEDPVLIKSTSEKRLVQIDSLRPVRESLDQLYVKEFESTWINEMQRYDTLGKTPPESSKGDKRPAATHEDDKKAD